MYGLAWWERAFSSHLISAPTANKSSALFLHMWEIIQNKLQEVLDTQCRKPSSCVPPAARTESWALGFAPRGSPSVDELQVLLVGSRAWFQGG